MQKMTPVWRKIIALLEKKDFNYRLWRHQPVVSSREAARVRGSKLSQAAKALIFRADGKPILIVVPGNCRVATTRFKKLYRIKNLELIPAAEVKKLTGLERGAVPPLGNILHLPTYVDRRLLEEKKIIFNAGTHIHSLILSPADFLSLVQPQIGDFSQSDE